MENVEAALACLLKKGIVQVVDKLIESSEFTLRIKQMKSACMETRVEGGKRVIREQFAAGIFTPGESSALLEYTQAMHTDVESFLETNFASYLHLGKLDMEGLLLMCCDLDVERECPE
ncbi:unnamed protein product [Lactuca saligna]|uniref:Uncharacterized protein n=1 Tax=Lactuca saligna TaxID=75948 RepID=A0AA35YER7_LACSI|nr:unnamed protein product [Lactuca saligna]